MWPMKRHSIRALICLSAACALAAIATCHFHAESTRAIEIEEIVALPKHSELWTNADMSSDGRYLALTDFRHLRGEPIQVAVWDLSGRPSKVSTFYGPETICNAVSFSPDGRLLAMGGDSGYVLVADIAQQRIVRQFEIDGNPPSKHMGIDIRRVRCMEFSPNGELIAIGTDRSEVEIWETSSWAQLHKLPRHDRLVNDLAFSPTGGYLLTAGERRLEEKSSKRFPEAFLFETISWKMISECQSNLLPSAVKWISWLNETRFAVSDHRGNLLVVDAPSFETIAKLKGHENRVLRLATDEQRKLLISSSAEKSIVWDLRTFNAAAVFRGAGILEYDRENGIIAAAFTRDERTARLLRIVEMD